MPRQMTKNNAAAKSGGNVKTAARTLSLMGAVICFLCLGYGAFTIVGGRIAGTGRASGEKVQVLGGILAFTEGTVVRSGRDGAVISYYYEWDGAVYHKHLWNPPSSYEAGTVVPVFYSVGMAAGSCLVIGARNQQFLLWGIAGAVLLVLGAALGWRAG